jgi:hypothetical protein
MQAPMPDAATAAVPGILLLAALNDASQLCKMRSRGVRREQRIAVVPGLCLADWHSEPSVPL